MGRGAPDRCSAVPSEPAEQIRFPAPRGEIETRGIELPPAQAGSAAAPFRTRTGLIQAEGAYDAIDVWIEAPSSWANVVAELEGRVQGIDTSLALRRIGSVVSTRSGGSIRGLLFSVRGRAVSRFAVVAFNPDVAPAGEARLIARVGRGDVEASHDQADRPATDLYARPDQQRIFTTGGAGLAASPTTVLTANPRGAGLGITAISVSTVDTVNVGRFVLRYRPTAAGVPVNLWSCVIGGTELNVVQQFPQPVYTPADVPGAFLEATIAGIAPADVELSVEAFDR